MGDSPDNHDGLPWEEGTQDGAPSAAELEDAGQASMFGTSEPAPAADEKPVKTEVPPAAPVAASPADSAAQPYRVLARKYRPQTFAELIGQEAMVRTLANAIARGRLAHAFLMTGVRGVGKTSTARLIAKALNCVGPDGQGGPTISPCGECEPCKAIAEGRHIDVIEMDAASHTGVDDVREIIEAVRYAAVSARYKIYIIDEVHMLSRNAFNALLKTLEEPPAHVKFLFATTEVDKLPVTVLSRTQRFDLRRIPADMLQHHFAEVCRKEGVAADDEALHIVAAAAEGSVRDGLSILDQAIAHADLEGEGRVTAERVRDMLGLADKGAQRRLFGHVLEGDAPALLAAIDEQYALGVEPLAIVRALMDLTHRITVAQIGGGEADGATADERAELGEWAGRMGAGQLHRLWQLLLKGYDEVRQAPDPLVSLRMALLRVLHANDLPDPEGMLRRLGDLAAARAPSSGTDASPATAPAPAPQASLSWRDIVDRVDAGGNMFVAAMLRMQVRVVEMEPGKLVFTRMPEFTDPIVATVRDALFAVTGERWIVEEKPGVEGEATLVEQDFAERRTEEQAVRDHPLVRAAFDAFPDAELIADSPQNQPHAPAWSRKA